MHRADAGSIPDLATELAPLPDLQPQTTIDFDDTPDDIVILEYLQHGSGNLLGLGQAAQWYLRCNHVQCGLVHTGGHFGGGKAGRNSRTADVMTRQSLAQQTVIAATAALVAE